MINHVFGVAGKVKLHISLVASLDMILSNKWLTTWLTRLPRCAGWSAFLLFANPEEKVCLRSSCGWGHTIKAVSNKGYGHFMNRFLMVLDKTDIHKHRRQVFLHGGPFGSRGETICLHGFANNTGADQPAHPSRLIRTFVIHLSRSIISRLSMSEISIF